MKKNFLSVAILLLMSTFIASCNDSSCDDCNEATTVKAKIVFSNTVGTQALTLKTANYNDTLGETFSVSTLKYYVGEAQFTRTDGTVWKQAAGSYALIDASEQTSLTWPVQGLPDGTYKNLSFLVGVDSVYNVSGAQLGALDPLNEMFWDWNTGYVFFKLEGNTPDTTARYTLHVGGFRGQYNTIRRVNLDLSAQPLTIKNGAVSEIDIRTNVQKVLNGGPHQISIWANPGMMPGAVAMKCADNYATMFSLITVKNP
ncbi:hypothetical protein SAMN05421780_10128 [Flexibacter flexilis DSM 6793]|uniref:Copper-binding protein MbnP-like domain-containing protein n=1 Tax=Flexibacter flexilis DSM 6793 TaxID=927664 RepID=A0A1I1D7Y2_9BACT|nr:MbnP family protein [Flexibacter flexilis]SFB70914.1 hypothetical protein SAMN05421780_10128 [Flexibacter flexilis DSM 6793]